MADYEDTICAIATPSGRGGIGIVRLSGPHAATIGTSLLRLRRPLAAGRARFGYFADPDPSSETAEAILDEVVATFFAAPKSYTGEDVLEIAMHGAPVVLEALLRAAMRRGARLAEPGEFTRRAFLSGRLDLTQAEAVNDLIQSTTLHQARVAANQMGGALARHIAPVKSNLVSLIAVLEAGIDFAEDDLDVLPQEHISSRVADLLPPLLQLERSFDYGQSLREGLTLAIVGRPNAGKSSLFNCLLERDRAIVTAIPGTTRDSITEQLSLEGVPLAISDTAGLRDSADEIESLGISRSREAIAESSILLVILDASEDLAPSDAALLADLAARPTIVVLNKADLAPPARQQHLINRVHALDETFPVVVTSAKQGHGIEELRAVLRSVLLAGAASQDSVFLTNTRQYESLRCARRGVESALAAVSQRLPHEMVLLDLHAGLNALDDLTGKTSSEDILNLIFSTFCIGK